MTRIMSRLYHCGMLLAESSFYIFSLLTFEVFVLFLHSVGGPKQIDDIPVIGLEEAVIDISDREEPDEEQAEDDAEEQSASDISNFPSLLRVVSESDLIGQPACIMYTKNLLQMAQFLQLPFGKCYYKDHSSGVECDGRPPFTVESRLRGTAVILEWVSSK